VYNKTGASQGTISLQSLFTGLSICGNGYTCDPQVVYDDENDRYVVTGLGINSTATDSRLCLAVSKAESPITAASNWWTYEIDPAGTGVADYPHTAVGEDAIFSGSVWFPSSGGNQSVMYVINKTKAYAGSTLLSADQAQYVFSSTLIPQAAERRGFDQGQYPPAGTPTYIITPNLSTQAHDLWRWNQPTLTSTPTQWQASVTSYPGSITNPSNSAYAQSYPIDGLDIRQTDVELRWPYLWTVRTGNNGSNFDTVQWNQINVSGSNPAVIQTNEYTLANNHLWMADCTVDTKQNFITVFNRASATGPVYVGGYLAGRQAGDPTNTLSGPVTVKAGEKVYQNGTVQYSIYRWGDYNGAAIDPNGCDIWVNVEYVRDRSTTAPSTGVEDTSYIASFRFADCAVEPSATLDKMTYFCVDEATATIVDATGTPTNAVYHVTSGGSVAGTISGTGPFSVTPASLSDLGAVHGDDIWLSFTGGDGNPYTSNNSTVDCQREVCVYQIDPLSGGCDDDTYHDRGEVLNYNIAIANYESDDLPGPFEVTLTCSDPDVTIINPTVTFPDLPSMTYAYGDYPFAVEYTGAWPANCTKTLTFNITNIHAIDDAWTNTGGGCSASQTFTEIANANFNVTGSAFTESFDSTTFPPTGWARLSVDTTGGTLLWQRSTATVHPSGYPTHSGAGLAYANTWTVYPPSSARLYRSTVSDLTSYAGATLTYWMFHDNIYTNEDYIQVQVCEAGTSTCATEGTHWVNVGAPVYRYNGSANVWTQHSVDLTAYAGAGHSSVQVGLLCVNDYGNDVHIDDVALNIGNLVCESTVCSGDPVLAYDQFAFDDTDCNDNGGIDPGEVGVVMPYLANTGNDWAYGTTATLSCPTCDAVFGAGMIQICDGNATYGLIPYGTGYVYAPDPSDPFTIAVDPSVACPAAGQQIPLEVTVQSTNPYGPVTLSSPVDIGIEDSINPDPVNGMSYYDRFEVAPTATSSTGRWGFSDPWTVSGTWSQADYGDGCWTDPDTGVAFTTGKNTDRYIQHTLSTVGATTNVAMWWEWDVGNLQTGDYWDIAWTPNGVTWCNLGLNDPGTAAGGDEWQCWSGSLYATVAGMADVPPCSGPSAADSMLNNPNFGIRFLTHMQNTNSTHRLAAAFLSATGWQCDSTTCSGSCGSAPPPPTYGEDVPGTYMTVTKGTNPNTVHVTWDPACGTPDNFNMYWGNLSTLGSTMTVTNENCSIGTSGNVDNLTSPIPAAGQGYWFVITAVTGSNFGRHGNNSSSTERSLTGDTAACGGTKDTTANSCAKRSFTTHENTTSLSPILPMTNGWRTKPLSRCNVSGKAPTRREVPEDGKVKQ